MRLCATLFVCWHVCKNRAGLDMILLQPLCLWYICLRLTWQYLFLALFCVESVQCNHQLKLNRVYREKWIGRGGPVAWPPRSPDLTPLDFSFGGKWRVLCTLTQTTQDKHWLSEYSVRLIKSDTVLACSPENDRQWHDDVKNVIRYRAHILNICNFIPTCRIKIKS